MVGEPWLGPNSSTSSLSLSEAVSCLREPGLMSPPVLCVSSTGRKVVTSLPSSRPDSPESVPESSSDVSSSGGEGVVVVLLLLLVLGRLTWPAVSTGKFSTVELSSSTTCLAGLSDLAKFTSIPRYSCLP